MHEISLQLNAEQPLSLIRTEHNKTYICQIIYTPYGKLVSIFYLAFLPVFRHVNKAVKRCTMPVHMDQLGSC
jgi:hypothetical protein